MLRTIVFLACLVSWSSTARETASATHVIPGTVGLVIVAGAQDGFAMAADGASWNEDGTISQEQKLFPIGKFGALAIAGTVSIQDPLTRPVREEVNVSRIVAAWLNSHPEAAVPTAGDEISAAISEATTKYFSTRDPGAARGRYKFALIFAGLVDGKPMVRVTRYFLPLAKGKPLRAERIPDDTRPGAIWMFGQTRVAEELISAKSTSLKTFRAEPSLTKLHSSPLKSLTAQEFADGFATVLRAAESKEGKKLIVGKPAVAPPNKTATIINKDGFAWSQGK